MKLYDEIYDLDGFEPWGGAKDTYDNIIATGNGELFIQQLDDIYPDGLTQGQLNDILWFNKEWCYDIVGLNSHGVLALTGLDVIQGTSLINEAIDKCFSDYINDNTKEDGTRYTREDFDKIEDCDFEQSLDNWLEDNQEDDTDEDCLAERWLEDVGYDEIDEAIHDALND